MDCCIEGFGIGESHVGEVIGLKVMPDRLDIIEFGSIFGQPFNGEPMGAGRQRRLRGLADMDWTVIEHHNDGLGLKARFGAVEPVEFFQKSDEIGAALGL
jgi:hypothetical protein